MRSNRRRREYKTVYILTPELTPEKIRTLNKRVKALIENNGGQLLDLKNWGKRPLAYEIQKQRRGIYLCWHYLGNTKLVRELERNLRLTESAIRFHSLKIANNTNQKIPELNDQKFEEAATPAPDEEALVTGEEIGIMNNTPVPISSVNTTPKRSSARGCELCIKLDKHDYKDINPLRNYVTDRGKLISGRTSKSCAHCQRRLSKVIKHARILALLPYANTSS